MIQINLLPPDMRRKESPKILLPEIPIKKTLVIVAGSIIALQLLLSLAAGVLAFQSGATKAAIEKLSSEVAETRRIKEASVGALNKLKDIRTLTNKKFYWASLLNAITDSVSKGVWLRSLSLDETIVEV
jgi:Tfp pilus assembly protein PilN